MHRIRLREPWQPVDLSDMAPDLRESLGDLDRASGAFLCFARSFNRPTGLEPEQQVLLELRPCSSTQDSLSDLAVTLNDILIEPWTPASPLPAAEPGLYLYRTESHLTAANKIVVAIRCTRATPAKPNETVQFTDLASANLLILEQDES
ncbi:MAG: hypothetical protein AB8B50_11140 [Pirellulaceae bacterium]